VSESLNRIMERVTAQQSAGVVTVKERIIDRPRGAPRPDEEDREAAREIRAALGKKRGKRKAVPLYQRLWVQALGILVALAVVIGLLALALRPPGADRLHRQAQRLVETGDPDKQYEARQGPIVELLTRYPDDPRAEQVRQWADKVDVPECEEKLDKMFRSRKGLPILIKVEPETDMERLALRGVLAEDSGDLATSQDHWRKLRDECNEKSLSQRPWRLIADKHLHDLNEVETREKQLRSRIGPEGEFAPDFKPKSDSERLAAEALRNELLKKLPEAREGWVKVKEESKDKTGEQRLWALLAAKKTRELADKK
jgi:hypothetical protein